MPRVRPSHRRAVRWTAAGLCLPAAAWATVATPLPEPDTLALLAVAAVAAALAWARKRRK